MGTKVNSLAYWITGFLPVEHNISLDREAPYVPCLYSETSKSWFEYDDMVGRYLRMPLC